MKTNSVGISGSTSNIRNILFDHKAVPVSTLYSQLPVFPIRSAFKRLLSLLISFSWASLRSVMSIEVLWIASLPPSLLPRALSNMRNVLCSPFIKNESSYTRCPPVSIKDRFNPMYFLAESYGIRSNIDFPSTSSCDRPNFFKAVGLIICKIPSRSTTVIPTSEFSKRFLYCALLIFRDASACLRSMISLVSSALIFLNSAVLSSTRCSSSSRDCRREASISFNLVTSEKIIKTSPSDEEGIGHNDSIKCRGSPSPDLQETTPLHFFPTPVPSNFRKTCLSLCSTKERKAEPAICSGGATRVFAQHLLQ